MKINKQIYKRLTIVLAIPLLLLGTYFAENKLFQDTEMLVCNDDFACFKAIPLMSSYSGLFMNGVKIPNGINEEIVTSGERIMGFKNGEAVELEVRNKDIKKRLTAGKNQDDGYCTLAQYANQEDNWNLSCVPNGMHENFKFINVEVAQKYKKLSEITRQEADKRNNQNKIGFVLAVATPLAIYLALSLIMFFLAKIVRYVIYGNGKTT